MDDAREVREVIVTADGPVLITGPVEVVLPDGRRVRSDRPVTALCVCRRSRRAPFCDTSHRRKIRTTADDPTGHPSPTTGQRPRRPDFPAHRDRRYRTTARTGFPAQRRALSVIGRRPRRSRTDRTT